MTYVPPCVGAPAYLFYPDAEERPDGKEVSYDADFPAPEFCTPEFCDRTLACLTDGWLEDFGTVGGFTLAERMKARMSKQTPEELWGSRYA